MPIYKLQCDDCDLIQEQIVSKVMTEEEIKDGTIYCERCWGRVKKLPGAPHAHFKGSGFYETDYKRKADSDDV